ncbi:hypothetical protein AXG93_4316s1510 [Marchantia polymorpha subsp. ruderalis]|uniref:RRM domain-containing protein n=1 Tax=Marchantia polymorpha subsp. ruderalis TaxID=1480154 RepID=A0A176VSC9_MARPO|nr:hypothetical protein AXG93_4316s1510 [Marchantia polymorpha subsp. ruderalis]
MRRRSPSYSPPPRRGHGGRGRSPSPSRGRYGRRGDPPTSLLVRNIPRDCRSEDLRLPFERYGVVKDVYLPKDYYTGLVRLTCQYPSVTTALTVWLFKAVELEVKGASPRRPTEVDLSGYKGSTVVGRVICLTREPRGFGFVQYMDPGDAAEAQYHMDHQVINGREITVVFAEENRKKPQEMRSKERIRGRPGHSGSSRRRSPYYVRSRSRSPRYSGSPRKSRHSRSYTPTDRGHRRSYSPSPSGSRRRGRSGKNHSRSPSPAPRKERVRSPTPNGKSVSPAVRSPAPRSPPRSHPRSPPPSRSHPRSPPSRSKEPTSRASAGREYGTSRSPSVSPPPRHSRRSPRGSP